MERQAAIYVRISEDKTGAGLGIERQEADCRALAGRLGWDVVEPIYSDNDVSAYSGKPRPGYRHLLADLRTGVADAVLCWHTDRLHRSPVELEEYIEVCQPREIPTQTVKAGPLDLATPSGRLMARQLGAYARFESEHHSDRAKRARLQAATDGRWLGGLRPFGYGADGMALIEAEAEAIRWMAAEVLAGTSLRSIARKLNAEGTFTSQGRPWTSRAVAWLLRRPRNAGLSQHQGEPIGPAKWPAILDSDTWRGVVAVLGDPARNTTTSRARRWLLSGLALCGVCGKPVRSGGVAVRGDRPGPLLHLSGWPRPPERGRAGRLRGGGRGRAALPARRLRAAGPGPDRRRRRPPRPGRRAPGTAGRAGPTLWGRLIDALQLASGTAAIRTQREQVTASLAAASRSGVLQGVADAPDPATVWEGLDLSRRRAIVDVLLEVTILRTKRGGARRKGETSFDPASVAIEWKRG